ncbi:serine hydrolase [Streptomyces albulus]|nr:serine hydrolase [Streptomyces noursei]
MVSHSSNLASSLCLAAVGPVAVAEVWRRAGASAASGSPRGIEDAPARAAGLTNQVTAHDLVRLLTSLEPEVLARLEHNAHAVDLAAGLPPAPGWPARTAGSPGCGTAPPSSTRPMPRPTSSPSATPARSPTAGTPATRGPPAGPALRPRLGLPPPPRRQSRRLVLTDRQVTFRVVELPAPGCSPHARSRPVTGIRRTGVRAARRA